MRHPSRQPAPQRCGKPAPALRAAALHWLLALLALLAALAAPGPLLAQAVAGSTPPLQLSAQADRQSGWQALQMLRPAPPQAPADALQAWQRRAEFATPAGPHGNLGPHAGDTWLHLPLQLAPDAPARWYLSLGYALLHEVQVSVLDAEGRLLQTIELGALVAHRDRPLHTRALVAPLQLQPGQLQHLMLRVNTPTAQLVEPVLMQSTALLSDESAQQALQGLMTGLWLFMMLYSLVSALHSRQAVFLAYAGALAASWLFSLAFYGHGAVWLWPDSGWLAGNMTALAPGLMVMANAQFFVRALDMPRHAPWLARSMHVLSLLAALAALAFATGLLDYARTALTMMVLGLLHLLLAMPAAWSQRAAGDRGAGLVLLGCSVNLLGVAALSLLLRGGLPVSFLTLHLVQFTYALEMVCWLLALGMRLQALRSAATAAQSERDALKLLAGTDPLTGLHNRRALDAALEQRLAPSSGPQPAGSNARLPLALFLLDLDGFKAVNDRWGHEAGDQLLREVARRLRQVARSEDLVARLGGDEFVVLVAQPAEPAGVEQIGARLLAQFDAPFELGNGRQCRVGATVGYALAPAHGRDAAALLRAADSAMYAGKQAGRSRLVAAARGADAPAMA